MNINFCKECRLKLGKNSVFYPDLVIHNLYGNEGKIVHLEVNLLMEINQVTIV